MSADLPTPRWFEHRTREQREDYAFRFVRIAEGGDDIDGEARFVDAMAGRGAAILDAGCGTGRVAAALAKAGHRAVGVDADPVLIEHGRSFYPGLPLAVLDLVALSPHSLAEAGLPTAYDVVVCPGNVMLFLADGTHEQVVANLASVLAPGGRLAVGFFTGKPEWDHDRLDDAAAEAGLVKEHRFADWELRPWTPASDWAVSVHARPTAD